MPLSREIVAAPAAGVEHSYEVTQTCLLRWFATTFVTGSDTGFRVFYLVVTSADGDVVFRTGGGGTHTASLTRQYIGRPGDFVAPAVSDTVFVCPLPREGVPLEAEDVITTEVVNFDAVGNEDAHGDLILVFET